MAVSRVKEWEAGEVLSAADLNDEFDNLNQTAVAFPLTDHVSCAGYTVSNAVLGTLKQLNDNVVCIDNYASFAAAISSIGSTVTTLIINKNTNVTANATVPSTLTLWFMGQGKLTVSVATTTTINGPVIAAPRQIFAGSGAVAGFSLCPEVYPDWWGTNTTPGTTDMASAVQSAVTALSTGGTIRFLPQTYKMGSGITGMTNYTHVIGSGADSVLSKEFNGTLFYAGGFSKFKDIKIEANGGTYTGPIWRFAAGVPGQEISGCYVDDGEDSICLFEDLGGSLCHIHDNTFHIADSVTGGAVVKRTVTTQESEGAPRYFHHNICIGPDTWFADVNGFQSAYFDNIYCQGMNLGDNTLNALVTNCRIAVPNGMTATISGNSVTMTNCIIGGSGSLTLANGFIYGVFAHNTMDPGLTFTDNTTKLNVASIPFVEDPRYAGGRQVPVMDTAQLPAASATMNGRIIIENAGAGDRNLIVYAGGQRFRIDGGANV